MNDEFYKALARRFPEMIPEPFRLFMDLYGFDALCVVLELL